MLINSVNGHASEGDGVAQKGLWCSKQRRPAKGQEPIRRVTEQRTPMCRAGQRGALPGVVRRQRAPRSSSGGRASGRWPPGAGEPAGGLRVWAQLRGGASAAAAADNFLSCLGLPRRQGRCLAFPSCQAFSTVLVIHTVKDFSVVSEAEVDGFWNSFAFSVIQWMLAI